MLRVSNVGAVLFTLASTAVAGEHYVEIWNPPEARLVKPAAQNRPRTGKPALISGAMPKGAARRVADPPSKAASVKHSGGEANRKRLMPSAVDIPRIMTPEGNVLRVGTGVMAVAIVR